MPNSVPGQYGRECVDPSAVVTTTIPTTSTAPATTIATTSTAPATTTQNADGAAVYTVPFGTVTVGHMGPSAIHITVDKPDEVWVGFGFGPNPNMFGAEMLIVDSDSTTWRTSSGMAEPAISSKVTATVVMSNVENGRAVYEIILQGVEWPELDSGFSAIYAQGSSQRVSYHGYGQNQRGGMPIQKMGNYPL